MDQRSPHKITQEWLRSYRTPRGGWTAVQMACCGVRWKPDSTGWQERVEGKEIPRFLADLFEQPAVEMSPPERWELIEQILVDLSAWRYSRIPILAADDRERDDNGDWLPWAGPSRFTGNERGVSHMVVSTLPAGDSTRRRVERHGRKFDKQKWRQRKLEREVKFSPEPLKIGRGKPSSVEPHYLPCRR